MKRPDLAWPISVIQEHLKSVLAHSQVKVDGIKAKATVLLVSSAHQHPRDPPWMAVSRLEGTRISAVSQSNVMPRRLVREPEFSL